MTESWYALHVKTRFEKYVTGQLRQKGYEVLLPTYVSRRKWSDRTKTISLPLFPGYVFCSFNINARLPIVVTPGVMAIVGAGRTPAAIERAEVAALTHVMDSGVKAEPCPFLSAGTRVRVESGPLAGLTGLVARIQGRDRLIVSVSLVMRSLAVEIDRKCVSVLPDNPNRIREDVEGLEFLSGLRRVV